MPVWNVDSVDERPSITLVNWQIWQTELGERHFVGWNVEDREGRVSSKIDVWDPRNLRGKTASGRSYQLQGNPGFHPDAEYTWNVWCTVNGVTSAEVVEIYNELNDGR